MKGRGRWFLPAGSGLARGLGGLGQGDVAFGRAKAAAFGVALGATLILAALPSAPAQARESAAQAVAACAMDLTPHEGAASCAGQLMDRCMEAVSASYVEQSLRCWAEEEQAWDDWTKANISEAAARIAPDDKEKAAKIEAAADQALQSREAFCALQLMAFPQDDDGPLMQARCRTTQAARLAVDLYWLGVP